MKAHCKPKAHLSLKDDVYNEEIYTFIKTHFIHEIQHSLQMMAKSERHSALKNILQYILAHEAGVFMGMVEVQKSINIRFMPIE